MKSTIKLALASGVLLALAPLAPSVAVPPSAPAAAASVAAVPNATWSVNAAGWTVFNGSPGTGTCGNSSSNYTGTCVVYVANAGNDATCAAQPLPVTATPTHPCATATKAQSLLRNNSADWLLFKKGDKWSGGMSGPGNGTWSKNGKSAAEPMLISSYGTGARPLFTTAGVDTGCYNTIKTNGQFMAVVGIECYVDFADPSSPTYLGVTASGDISAESRTITGMTSTKGILPGYAAFGSGISGLWVVSVTANSVTLSGNPTLTSAQRPIQFNKASSQALFSSGGLTNFLTVEDCKFSFGGMIIGNNPAAPVSGLNLRIRRDLILDAYTLGRPSNGFFLGDNQLPGGQILIEENIVDHSGYNTSLWGAGGTIYSHNFYLHQNNPPITFVRNITSNASATGAQVRNGGTISDNLSIGNPIAFSSNPGVQFNPTTYSYNVITEASDIIAGIRTATGATAPGAKVLQMDGVFNGFINNNVADLDNPGAITGLVTSVTATTATMKLDVAAGQRGNGVVRGDRLAIYVPRAVGIVIGPTGAFFYDVNTGGAIYPSGNNVFHFPSGYPLPSWVVPGMNIAMPSATAFPGGKTIVASVSGDRTQLTTSAASVLAFAGGSAETGEEQGMFVIWKTGDYSHVPQQTIGPNNIFTNSMTSAFAGASAALSLATFTQNVSATQNYYYNWSSVVANNVSDLGVSGTNTTVPNPVNLAASTRYPNATIEAYDASIGGPGTAAHFLAQARLQSKDSWDVRYTATAANNYIRKALGCNCAQ